MATSRASSRSRVRQVSRLIAVVVLSTGFATDLVAQDWPTWRGPNYDGSATAQNLPTDFDREKHVRWATVMPGPGASTPIVIGDRIFLTSVDTKRERLVALCLHRKDGRVLWSKDAGSGYKAHGVGTRTARGNRTTYASPSPVSDGERVVFFFGNGDLVAYDLEGQELWRRNVQKDYGDFAFQWTFSATPTLWDGRLFLPILQRDTPVVPRSRGRRNRRRGRNDRRRRRNRNGDAEKKQDKKQAEKVALRDRTVVAMQDAASKKKDEQDKSDKQEKKPAPVQSFFLAIDPLTGKTLYRHLRPSPARVESLESYTTMIPRVGKKGTKELVLAGGDVLTGHDPATGKELWRWGTWNEGHRQQWWRLVPSVVMSGDIALVCAPKRAPVYAVKLGGRGDLGDDALLWESEGRPNPVSSDVPTPAVHDGHFFVLSDVRNALSKVAVADGEVKWTTSLSKDYRWRTSPTVADGKIWFMNHHGDVVIVDATSGRIVAQVAMGREDDDNVRSSIVVAHGDLFIRVNDRLFCIGR